MVAYSFNRRFYDPIKQGLKRQTVRLPRNRHARVGEELQLFVGMRTLNCQRIIDNPVCSAVMPIQITFGVHRSIDDIIVNGIRQRSNNAFAIRDGFEDERDMCAFWNRNHKLGACSAFSGVLIEWVPAALVSLATPPAPQLEALV